MGQNRSRSRDRKKSRDRSRSRDRKKEDKVVKSSRDRSVSKDRKSRDKRSRSKEHRRRDRSRSRDKKHRDRRHRSKSTERRKKREHSRDRKRDRSSSRRKHRRSSSSEEPRHVPPKVKVLSLEQVMRKKRRAEQLSAIVDHRQSFQISDEFSQEDFTKFSLDHGIDLTNIETDEDRVAIHEKMEDVLKAHFAAQGKIYPPPKVEKPAINAATGFANDGSFLEQFKKMQDDYKKQQEDEKKRKAHEERLKSLPIRRRGGGMILKTGVVAKSKVLKPSEASTSAGDSFSSYLKEVQKYKTTSCDGDSKTRPLVK